MRFDRYGQPMLNENNIRRKCFEFLKGRVTLTPDGDAVSMGEAIMTPWMELEPDLSELDEYGGGGEKANSL